MPKTSFFTAVRTGLSALLLLISPSISWAQDTHPQPEPRFFENLNDIPLMPGLFEMIDETVIFDKPEGRIVESSAATESVAPAAIEAFYDSTLPQLGWERTTEDLFTRQNERLQIQIEKEDGYSVVHIMVAPR